MRRLRHGLLFTVPLLTSLFSAAAQSDDPLGFVPLTQPGGFDNAKGSWVTLESTPFTPIGVDPFLGGYLLALNVPGMKLAVSYLPSDTIVAEIDCGQAPSALAHHPVTNQLWVSNSAGRTVTVIDVPSQTTIDTVEVGGQPHGIVIDPAGTYAYVACAGTDTVEVVDTATLTAIQSIPIPGGPRAITWHAGKVWVAPFLSGNNTVPRNSFTIWDLVEQFSLGQQITPLPDRDLFCIDPANLGATNLPAATGLGTVLFGVHGRPGTNEIWVTNTEALNARFCGEKNFPAGQVVENRITIVDATKLTSKVVVLDDLAPEGVGCAQPNAVVFDSARNLAYVAAYGSDLVAMLDTTVSPPSWVGHAHVPAGSPERRSGPRGLALTPEGDALYVYNYADNSYSRIELAGAPALGMMAEPPVSLGWTPEPEVVRRGRGHLINADNSLSRTSSCASCHIDNHHDNEEWDLSAFLDPEGTECDELTFPSDQKGVMTTQSLRGLFETPPYHWRGERDELIDFNAAFTGLLERTVDGELQELPAVDFAELEAFIAALTYPPNPSQAVDRSFSTEAELGHGVFTTPGSCVGCHTMPLGTNNLVMRDSPFEPARSAVVTQLRGVGDKVSDLFEVGGPIGPRPEHGSGLAHNGVVQSLLAFASSFPVSPDEAQQLAVFMEEFDTGMAPAAAWQDTLHLGNAATFEGTSLAFILGQAKAGHCDVVGTVNLPGVPAFRMVYDHTSERFQLASATAAQLDPNDIVPLFVDIGGSVTFRGLPLGLGWMHAVDRDADGLLDVDEYPNGTDWLNPDTDGDGLPDGHEVEHGTDPTVVNDASPDKTKPTVFDGPVVVYHTTNSIKVELAASEPVQVTPEFAGVVIPTTPTSPRYGGYAVTHSIVIPMIPDNLNNIGITLRMRDPAGNETPVPVTISTDPALETIRVAAIDLVAVNDSGAKVEVSLSGHLGSPAAGDLLVEAFAYYEDDAQPLEVIGTPLFEVTDCDGKATFALTLDPDAPTGRLLHFGVREVLLLDESLQSGTCTTNLPGAPEFYVEANDLENFETFDLDDF